MSSFNGVPRVKAPRTIDFPASDFGRDEAFRAGHFRVGAMELIVGGRIQQKHGVMRLVCAMMNYWNALENIPWMTSY
jgi:hypothetical protein